MTTVAIRLALIALAGTFPFLVRPVAAQALPPVGEVYELLQQKPPGLGAEELNRAALAGLVRELDGRLAVPGMELDAAKGPAVAKAQPIDPGFAWVRLARIDGGTPAAFDAAVASALAATNPVRGLVLDLRETEGRDYAAAGELASRFFAEERPLLTWTGGKAESAAKTNALLMPVSILVNARTRGAAEALAAVLRRGRVGLVLGEATSGQARVMEERTLPSGAVVWVAGDAVALADGEVLEKPVTPDIAVPVERAQETLWLEDPFLAQGSPAGTSTNGFRPRRRVNEAVLVRQREGGSAGEPSDRNFADAWDAPPPSASLQDPALARALDLIKGLAVIRPRRNG
jgi:hypothetical protein